MKLFRCGQCSTVDTQKQAIRDLEGQVKVLESEIDGLRDQLNLEKTWAAGEIEFWQEQCHKAEDALAVKQKPWWRYVIS